MKVQLDLKRDSHNTYCDNEKLTIEFSDDGDLRKDSVWLKIGDREIEIDKSEFKKAVSII